MGAVEQEAEVGSGKLFGHLVAGRAPAPCLNCGTAESVPSVKGKWHGNGARAVVGGGVRGGVVGNTRIAVKRTRLRVSNG